MVWFGFGCWLFFLGGGQVKKEDKEEEKEKKIKHTWV